MTPDYFRSNTIDNTSFFDETPAKVKIKTTASTLTSSIDTSEIDAYRQGVELTQFKHYDAGIAKIWAGEPGHVLRKNRFGMDRNFRTAPAFEELDYFSPVTFLLAQDKESTLWFNIITFPIITSDNDQVENFIFDGIIEPFSIRPRASFFSFDVPFEAHEVKGAVMGGNTDSTWASDQIETIYTNDFKHQIPYLDMIDMIDGRYPLPGFFTHDKSTRTPFADSRYPNNVPISTTNTTATKAALSLMSGSTDNYIASVLQKRSATCGWDYDNNVNIGTDSIVYGGKTY